MIVFSFSGKWKPRLRLWGNMPCCFPNDLKRVQRFSFFDVSLYSL